MRIELEDQQQDLLWLDVDDATGRIIDCGPFHQDIYATGEMSVELESIEVGGRPFLYKTPQEKAEKMGYFLRFHIEDVTESEVE